MNYYSLIFDTGKIVIESECADVMSLLKSIENSNYLNFVSKSNVNDSVLYFSDKLSQVKHLPASTIGGKVFEMEAK